MVHVEVVGMQFGMNGDMVMGKVEMKSMVLYMVYVVEVKAHMMRFDMMKGMDGDMAHGRQRNMVEKDNQSMCDIVVGVKVDPYMVCYWI